MRIESLLFLGVILIFMGIILTIISSMYLAVKSPEKSNVKVAAGGFIGPIPFGFFSDKKIFYVWLILFALVVIFYFLFRKFWV